MAKHAITDFYPIYCTALDWAVSLIPKLPKHCKRFFEYKDILKQQFDEYQRGEHVVISERSEMIANMETHLEAFALVDIYKKFALCKDTEFIRKLRESFYGPSTTVDEETGGSKSKGSFARNILSELILASKFKNPEKVSFQEHDIVYDLGDSKFGVEVKRIQEEANIVDLFADACRQLQQNSSIEYGMIALRLDKYFFTDKKGGIILPKTTLFPREDVVFRANSEMELYKDYKFQTDTFHKQFEPALGTRMAQNEYKKVAGYCVFIYTPALVGKPSVIFASGYASFILWHSNQEPKRKDIFDKIIEELEFNGNKPDIRHF